MAALAGTQTLVIKWNKQQLVFPLGDCSELTTVGDLKRALEAQSSVPTERMKLFGLPNLPKKPDEADVTPLASLKLKKPKHTAKLMGTPDAALAAALAEASAAQAAVKDAGGVKDDLFYLDEEDIDDSLACESVAKRQVNLDKVARRITPGDTWEAGRTTAFGTWMPS